MRILGLFFIVVVAACGSSDVKGVGDVCFASSECAEGLVCDFGQTPSICATMQTAQPDAAPMLDAEPAIDADPSAPDANLSLPDAATPRDAPGLPDAATPPDAPGLPDAALPDANLTPDAV